MAFYGVRHYCATRLRELGLTPADVAVRLCHTDGGSLVMSTYGDPSENDARAGIVPATEAERLAPDGHLRGTQLVEVVRPGSGKIPR